MLYNILKLYLNIYLYILLFFKSIFQVFSRSYPLNTFVQLYLFHFLLILNVFGPDLN